MTLPHRRDYDFMEDRHSAKSSEGERVQAVQLGRKRFISCLHGCYGGFGVPARQPQWVGQLGLRLLVAPGCSPSLRFAFG